VAEVRDFRGAAGIAARSKRDAVIMPTMNHRPKLARFVTIVDAKSAEAAMLMALAVIDAGAFSKHPESGDDGVG
jgi:hypothetical protein